MKKKRPIRQEHVATLDILRLVAALSVVIFHYFFRGAAADGYLAEGYPDIAPLAIYGYLGVNLFFLISGFVIAWSAESSRSWVDFAAARFSRLYPGFVICMTLTFLVLLAASDPRYPASFSQWAANLLMFSPALGQPFVDGVYWSIVLEIVFYGWVALAVATGVFSRWKLELVTVWLAICAINEFYIGSGAMRMLFITEFGPLFAAGILFHHMHSNGPTRETLGLLAAALMMSTATMGVTQSWMQEHYGVSVPLGGLIVANIVIHAIVWFAVRFRRFVATSPALLALGGLTYPLYLLHQNIGYLAIDALAPTVGKWAAAILVIAAMLALSYAMWRFVETPARRATRRLIDRIVSALRLEPAGLGRPL